MPRYRRIPIILMEYVLEESVHRVHHLVTWLVALILVEVIV